MPILLPPGLPATRQLRAEGIAVREAADGSSATLLIGLVNLMPDKPAAERQLARLLGAAPETVALSLHCPAEARGSRTPAEHIAAFYAPLPADVGDLDGLIVTGAPVETLPFSEVRYWDALAALLDAAARQRVPTLGICWAAMAMLHQSHGVAKQVLPRKAFGLFPQTVDRPAASLVQGLGARYAVPVSRHAAVRAADLAGTGATVLAGSMATGVSIAEDPARAQTMLLDHFEYEDDTLIGEFLRDRAAALPAAPPANLARPNLVPATVGEPCWRGAAHIVFRNWLAAVAREKAGRAPHDLLAWLSAGAPPGEAGAMLVLRGRPGADPLAAAAEAARSGVMLDGFSRDARLGVIVLRLAAGVTVDAAERLAAACLGLPGIHGSLLRGPGDTGALLHRAA
jgi:homoserine O-succinyltransferase